MSPVIKITVKTLFCLAFLMMASMAAAAEKDFSVTQEEKINQMIRAYILEHPEILPEAIQILQTRGRQEKLTQNHSGLYEDGFSHVGGNKYGDVTIIEFFDYNCGYCKRALNTVERLKKEDGNLRIIYKEFPILSEASLTAAKAAMSARNQGKYEAFHMALLRNSGSLTEARIFEIAREVGLDEKKLVTDMTSSVHDRNIEINRSLAQALNITGTPAFIIGDEIAPGALPYAELAKLVAKARQKKSD